MDIAKRFPENPILRPSDLRPGIDGMEIVCLLNPGVFRLGGRTGLLLRVAERPRQEEGRISFPIYNDRDEIEVLSFDKDDSRLDASDPRVIKYNGQNYLADQITVPRFSTDLPEFAEAEKAVQAKIDKFMSIQGNESVDSIHKKLGHIMWEYVGMGRTAEGLKKGIAALKEIRKEFETNLFIPGSKEGMNVELDKAIRLYDFITMGELVAYDALNRNESCGGHFREEYQTEEGEAKRDDENFFYVACWEYQGDDEKAPILIKEPLVYEAIKVQTRNYKS